MSSQIALGVDIGGTNTVFGVVNNAGEILLEDSFPTKGNSPEILVDRIFNRISQKINTLDLIGIGVGAPNGNQTTGCIEFAPNLEWEGIVPIRTIFETEFKVKTVLVNDANAAAVGEFLFGQAVGVNNFVMITLGTGLGSGIFVDGKLLTGAHGFAGEYGHVRVINNGRLCGCGRNGCLETYASSTGVVRTAKELLEKSNLNTKLSLSDLTAERIFHLAKEKDELCLEVVDYTIEILASALADFMVFSDPELFVLFGGIAQSGDFLSTIVEEKMQKHLLSVYKNKIKVKTSNLHTKNAAILGAASMLFYQQDLVKI